MPKRIGLLVDAEQSFAEALLARCNEQAYVAAELVEIGATAERHISRYDVLVDRASRFVPHYRTYLKACALAGVAVINDPFWTSADDEFFGLGFASRLGLATPRAVLLPQKTYGPEVDHSRGLRNLQYPLKWQELFDYVGLPAVLRGIDKEKRTAVTLINDPHQLYAAFDQSGCDVMMLQQYIEPATRLRVVAVGPENVLITELLADGGPSPVGRLKDSAVLARVRSETSALAQALGYDVFSMDFAVRGPIPYLVRAPQPWPDLGRDQFSDAEFEQLVAWFADLAIAYARHPARAELRYVWRQTLDP